MIEDISPLSGLTDLRQLYLGYNEISNLGPLAALTSLERLNLDNNEILDLTSLSRLTELTELHLRHNRIVDISPLVSNPGLGDGDVINIAENPLSDDSLGSHVPALKARGAAVTSPLHVIDEFPNSRLATVYNDNVIVMHVEEDVVSRDLLDALDEYASDLYHWFEDEFDYLMFLSAPRGGGYNNAAVFGYLGIYLHVKNDTAGIGISEFFNSSFGSAGRLRGAIHFPRLDALRYGPSLHEVLHAWANHSVPTAEGAHWGFSSANGQLGGFNFDNLEDLGGNRWTAGSFGTYANGGNSVPYSPIELYLSGLIPREDVPDLWVAENGEWLVENDRWVTTEGGAQIFTAPSPRTYAMADLVAEHGERNPAMVERPGSARGGDPAGERERHHAHRRGSASPQRAGHLARHAGRRRDESVQLLRGNSGQGDPEPRRAVRVPEGHALGSNQSPHLVRRCAATACDWIGRFLWGAGVGR